MALDTSNHTSNLDTRTQTHNLSETDINRNESASPYNLVTDKNPYAAAGRGAAMLLPFRNFSLLPFGQINALIIGAVNRKHYHFLLKDGQPVGFFAWAYASEAAAEKWLQKNDTSDIGDGTSGDCVVFNIWRIDKSCQHDPQLRAFLLQNLRRTFVDKRIVFARRVYSNGRTRPMRMVIRKHREQIKEEHI